MLYQLSYGTFHTNDNNDETNFERIRGTGLEPALRESQPLVPSRLHHPLSAYRRRDLNSRPPGS
jgi:hypothetical protein